MAEPMGDNVIVIQTCEVSAHLEPVKQYFASYGIATEIIQKGSWYLLITKDRYDNPEKSGTDGFEAKEQIKKLGAGYKAPPGYVSFGAKPFQDAYGMRIKN